MNNKIKHNTTAHIVCGQVCSGKTTFAQKLENENSAIRITPDEWMLKLYPDQLSNDEFDSFFYRCCEVAWDTSVKIFGQGIDVVLDFGFWKKDDRTAYKEKLRILGVQYKLYYIMCDNDIIRQRLHLRNQNLPFGTFLINDEMFDYFSPQFEAPQDEENYILINNN